MAKYYWSVQTQSETLIYGPTYYDSDDRDQEIVSGKSSTREQRLLEVPNGVDERYVKVFNNAGTLELQADIDSAKDAYRDWRVLKLKDSDWTQLADSPLAAQDKTDWSDYRQRLRDWPSSPDTAASKEFSLNTASAQNDLKIEADASDPSGNAISFEYVDPQGNDQTLSTTYSSEKISVSGATDGSGNLTSTVQNVIDDITASAAPVTASLVSGATGTDIADTEVPEDNLEGGGDSYNPYFEPDPDGNT